MTIRKRKLVSKEGGDKTLPSSKPKFELTPESRELFKAIEKQHGNQTVMRGDMLRILPRQATGILALDLCLGGGFVYSASSMLLGEKSSGKTTVALLTVAQVLKSNPDKFVVWLDLESTLDKVWAKKLGVDIERLYVVSPDCGEDAIDLAVGFCSNKQTAMIVTDSIAALMPMKDFEASAESLSVASTSRLIGPFMKRLNLATIRERKVGHNILIMHINQFRINIGQMFGDNRTTPGGKALGYYMSHEVQLHNKEHKNEKGDDAGLVLFNEHTVKISKDKTGGRIKEGRFKIIRDGTEGFREGYIDQSRFMMTAGQRVGMYTGGGSSHKLEDCGVFRSHADVANFFYENPDKAEEYNREIIRRFRKLWNME